MNPMPCGGYAYKGDELYDYVRKQRVVVTELINDGLFETKLTDGNKGPTLRHDQVVTISFAQHKAYPV